MHIDIDYTKLKTPKEAELFLNSKPSNYNVWVFTQPSCNPHSKHIK